MTASLYEKLNGLRQELQRFLLVDALALPESEQIVLRGAFDTVDHIAARIRAREIQAKREMERRAAQMAADKRPDPEPEFSKPTASVKSVVIKAANREPITFGVKGCPE